jgi:tRNA(fMet)-specific endonuclease VapC
VRYLVDSDWVIDYLRGREEAVSLLRSMAPDGIAISILTFGEVYQGVLFGRDRENNERAFRNFLRGADVLTLNRSIMRRYAELRGNLRAQGQIIDVPDLLIAATAIYYHLIIVTRNLTDFERVPGLDIYRNT